jgi:hypothetical protein
MTRPTVTRERMDTHIGVYSLPEDSSGGAKLNGSRTGGHGKRGKISDVRAYLEEYGVEIVQEKPGDRGSTIYVLKHCVFDETHTGTSAAVQLWPKGTIGYKCFHTSCADKKWADVRALLEGDDWQARPESEAKRLLGYVKAILGQPGSEVFRDAAGVAYATYPVHGHHETHPVRSRAMRLWAGRVFYQNEKGNPAPLAVQRVLEGLEARALYDSPVRDVFLRLAQPTPDGGIWLDLGTDDHRAVHITADGVRVVADSPIKFLRKRGMLALPEPVAPAEGETLESLLRPFINVAPPKVVGGRTHDAGWVLYVAWLCSTLFPTGPFPILQLHGEQGSAKSTVADFSQALVDPNEADRNGEPRDARDLAIAARNSWLLVFDNLRYIPPWLSDALARMATGGGYRTRQLYSDDEEAIFKYKRPVLLTGVSEVVTAPDLLDRTVSLSLEVIGPNQRKSEATLRAEFAARRPAILGALLGVVSRALKALPDVDRTHLSRMADFVVRSRAVEVAMGWPKGTFDAAYEGARREAHELALEASPIFAVFDRWLRARRAKDPEDPARRVWTGNNQALLKQLDDQRWTDADTPHRPHPPSGWPRTPRALSGMLRSLNPHLRQVGIVIEYRPHRELRIVDMRTDATSAKEGDGAPKDGAADEDYTPTLRRATPEPEGADGQEDEGEEEEEE